ncbi:MAG: hypothetical protein EXS00_08680, partial [Phycisphaerales bacterium]|nr:hypothetical protein [Phycisphaerales bacterium]
TYLRQRAASELLGRAKPAAHGGFPLLVKLLDAAQDLSVQVHPDAAYSRRHPETHMKSEAWLVLEAQPRARLLRGINPNLSAAEFAQHVRGDSNLPPSQSRVPADLLSVPARVGDCHWLPSGLCHALGAGTLVAEVQTPSDTTFRIYDWGRGDPRRPLHIEEALECCLIGSAQNLGNSGLTAPITAVSAAIGQSGVTVRSLVAVEQFECDLITLAAGAKISGNPRGLPESWLCLSGSGSMGEIAVTRGGSILIPASCDGFCLSAIEPITALRTRARA